MLRNQSSSGVENRQESVQCLAGTQRMPNVGFCGYLMLQCQFMWFEQGQRPPSRQKPPPEALHLFQPLQGPQTGGFAPSPVLRAASGSLARPSTSASIMQQAGTATRSRPAPMLHPGRMTLADVQRLSSAAASTSQSFAAAGPVAAERAQVGLCGQLSSARPTSARPLSGRPTSSRKTLN